MADAQKPFSPDSKESIITIACCQYEPKVNGIKENLEKSVAMIQQAVSQGADFIVLPELANSGYAFGNRKEAFESSEKIPEGKAVQTWLKLARDHQVHIVSGCNEKSGQKLYNAAVFLGPGGFIGLYRKLHLYNEEKCWFEPGNYGVPVFKTAIGRIGIHICYDQWFCEIPRLQALQGADLLAVPTNWVPLDDGESPHLLEKTEKPAMANYLTMINAHINTVWSAVADRIGTERHISFIGRSLIVDPKGVAVSGPASAVQEDIIVARDCNLMLARKKNWNQFNVMGRDRRTDVYDQMLGYSQPPFPF
jgi:N-carbamoylputrescine amidase